VIVRRAPRFQAPLLTGYPGPIAKATDSTLPALLIELLEHANFGRTISAYQFIGSQYSEEPGVVPKIQQSIGRRPDYRHFEVAAIVMQGIQERETSICVARLGSPSNFIWWQVSPSGNQQSRDTSTCEHIDSWGRVVLAAPPLRDRQGPMRAAVATRSDCPGEAITVTGRVRWRTECASHPGLLSQPELAFIGMAA